MKTCLRLESGSTEAFAVEVKDVSLETRAANGGGGHVLRGVYARMSEGGEKDEL